MAKRKRDLDESIEENLVDKKSKKHHKRRKPKQDESTPAGTQPSQPSTVSVPKAQPSTAAPITATTHQAQSVDGSHAGTLEAPPGLSKGARKRWRKKQRLAAALTQRPPLKPAQTRFKDVPQAPETSRKSKQLAKPIVMDSSFRSFGTTALMPRRLKVWHEGAQNQAAEVEYASITKLPETQQATARTKTPSSDNEDADLARAEQNESESDSDGDDSSSSHSSATSDEQQELTKTTVPANRTQSLAPPTTTAAIRRTSFGNRATSVPSFSNSSDPVESFKRFSAWLHKGESDSEDSESEDADSDIEASRQTVPKEGTTKTTDEADELITEVISTPEDHKQDVDGTGGQAQSKDLIRPMSSDELEVEQLPRFSDLVAPPTPSNGSTWPANVGIKRQMSFLGPEPGGTPYGSGEGPDSEPNRSFHLAATNVPSDPFEILDDSQELLRAVDEISNAVFGSTRPLPASKTRRSLDPGNEARENGVLTSASSDRRMTRSMATPKASQDHSSGGNEGLRIPSTDPTTVYSHNAELVEPEDEPTQAGDEVESDSMSSNIDVATPGSESEASRATKSTSSLSELGKSPSPPPEAALLSSILKKDQISNTDRKSDADDIEVLPRKKRRMTGRTSKHFTPTKATRRRKSTAQELDDASKHANGAQSDADVEELANEDTQLARIPVQTGSEEPKRRTRASSKVEDPQLGATSNETSRRLEMEEASPPAHFTRSSTKKRKSTGKKSSYFTPSKPALDPEIIDRVDFYNTTASAKKARVPAGTSIAPVPPITAERFGIIQEKLWREPFWLLIAVTFLNKTTGRAAVPVFWALKEKYATPEALAKAEQVELCQMIHHLGLQNQRARRLISMAQAWTEQVPAKGWRTRTLHYPAKNDGREFKRNEIVEEDADDCAGALEIAHIPGCGPYAWDSWRIFCRDALRGVAEDYNGAGANDDFVPEWKKVLPGDKELRACLRWMWLREGWIWDHETGEKRRATEAEMEKAVQGEMEIEDPQERKFAAQAAGIEVSPIKAETDQVDTSISREIEHDAETPSTTNDTRPRTPEPLTMADDDDDDDNIVVTPVVSPATRKRKHRPSLRG